MGEGFCLKDGCNSLLFVLGVLSLVFLSISLYEIVQMGDAKTATLEPRGWLFCVAYPLAKLVLSVMWFVLACYDVHRKCRVGRADYYYLPEYLTELFSIVLTLFVMVVPPALIGAIAFCFKFGFVGDNTVISLGGDEFTQLLLVHGGIVNTELLFFTLVVELFPVYVLQIFRVF